MALTFWIYRLLNNKYIASYWLLISIDKGFVIGYCNNFFHYHAQLCSQDRIKFLAL